MKKFYTVMLLTVIAGSTFAQADQTNQMETRAKEMFRVITLNDKNAWIKFMKENFTKTLQDKPFKKKVATANDQDVLISRTEESTEANLEAKTGLFQQLHNDFGKGNITSLTTTDKALEMALEDHGRKATLKLMFADEAPFLIDGLSVNVINN